MRRAGGGGGGKVGRGMGAEEIGKVNKVKIYPMKFLKNKYLKSNSKKTPMYLLERLNMT